MKAIPFLLFFLSTSTFFAQTTAGEANFIFDFDLTVRADSVAGEGETEGLINIDFFDDEVLDLGLKVSHSIGERGKYFKNLNFKFDHNQYQGCIHIGYGWPKLYEFGDSIQCEDGLAWEKDGSIWIGTNDWMHTGGHLEFEKEYLHFESQDGEIIGWLLISGNVFDPSITLHQIGINKDMSIKTTTNLVFVNNEEIPIEEISVFPNPFNETLKIELPPINDSFEIQITDISGKEIYQNSLSGNALLSIETDTWSKGTYVITLTYGDQHLVSKLIK